MRIKGSQQEKAMKRSWRFKEIIAIIVSLVFILGMYFFIYLIMPVSSENKWKEIEIPNGATYLKVVDILSREGFIENRLAFLLLGRATSNDRSIKAGFYNLNMTMNPMEIFERLRKGMIVEVMITIPEGCALEDIKSKLIEAGLIDENSWQLVRDRAFLASFNITAPSLEGYIFPDSYNFAKGTDPRYIFSIMVHRMREKFDGSLMKRAAEIGMTENEVLTLASIIEREAVYDSERPLISAVYHNRLKKNMKLQADPTVLYGVRTGWKRVFYRDLARVTPYNTYVIKGLPPGPIASPGIKSIQAALYPYNSSYLFFVSKNNGRHHFSHSGEEHLRAVAFYRQGGNNKDEDSKEETN